MDALTGSLDGKARGAFLLRSTGPPWSVRVQDDATILVAIARRGVVDDDADQCDWSRGCRDAAADPFTPDDPATRPQVVIHRPALHHAGRKGLARAMDLGVAPGERPGRFDDAHRHLQMRGEVSRRLLEALLRWCSRTVPEPLPRPVAR
jgi:hypothetical protein